MPPLTPLLQSFQNPMKTDSDPIAAQAVAAHLAGERPTITISAINSGDSATTFILLALRAYDQIPSLNARTAAEACLYLATRFQRVHDEMNSRIAQAALLTGEQQQIPSPSQEVIGTSPIRDLNPAFNAQVRSPASSSQPGSSPSIDSTAPGLRSSSWPFDESPVA